MKPAVHLQTKDGFDFYKSVSKQFFLAKDDDTLVDFKKILWSERNYVEKDLIDFLSDDIIAKQHKMDDSDIDGWEFYKQMADKFSVLNHFYNRNA